MSDDGSGLPRPEGARGGERWEQAKRLFEAALSVPDDERAAFLKRACPEDRALRDEVSSLLAFHSDEPLPLERPAAGSVGERGKGAPMGHPDPAATADDLIGATISHYRIRRRLGSGSMGVVYLAHDTRLDRSVAIKFLWPRSEPEGSDEEALFSRFLAEARSVSSLDHPNVGAVYEIDRTEDGRPYIVMAHYAGETLKERLAGGRLAVDEAVDIGRQLAAGMEAAHRHGVVHRDLKPANVILTSDGTAKIIDFGIAKTKAGADLTRTGQTLGTVGYMSPEQATGSEVDARSDLWSLGVILYEMLTGRLPFDGPHPLAVLHAILHDEPAPWPRSAEVSPAVRETVARCLAKKPESRMPAAAAVAEALGRGEEAAAEGGARRRSLPSGRFVVALVLLAASALVALALLGGRDGPGRVESIAVLPFENLSGDPERAYFVGGMQEALINSLAQIEALRVTSRTSTLRYAEGELPLPRIAAELGVDAIVEGAVFPAGDTVRITVQLVDGRTDSQIWSAEYDRDLQDVLVLFSEVAESVAGEVEVALTPDEAERFATAERVDPRLFDLYLRGRAAFGTLTGDGFARAIGYFEEALRIDPEFARAWAALAGTHVLRAYMGFAPPGEAMALAERAAREASSLDDRLALGHTALGWVHLVNLRIEEAEAAFSRALDLNPNDVDALHGIGDVFSLGGDFERGLAYVERSRDLDPYSPIWGHTVAGHLFMMRRYEEAIAEADRVRARFPQAPVLGFRAFARWELERFPEAMDDLRILYERRPDLVARLDARYAETGPREAARVIAEDAARRATSSGIGGFAAALWYGRTRDADSTLAWLERAHELGAPDFVYAGIRPELAFLHADPRFTALLEGLGLAAVVPRR